MEFFDKFNSDKLYLIMHLLYQTDDWFNRGNRCQLLPEEEQSIKDARKQIWDTVIQVFKRLDPDFYKRMDRRLKNTKLIEERDTRVWEEEAVVKFRDLNNMASAAMIICNQTKRREYCIKYKKCDMYKMLKENNIPPACLNTDACPYRFEWYNNHTKKWNEVLDIDTLPDVQKDGTYNVCVKCENHFHARTQEEEYPHCPMCGAKLGEWRGNDEQDG